MTDSVHKGQKQVVEGSAVGEYYVVPKFAYNSMQAVEYMSEVKVGIADHVARHFIQKLIYDCVGNIERILIATNKYHANSTSIDIIPINSTQTRIILNTGDFNEAIEGDAVHLKTLVNDLMGDIYKKESDSQIVILHAEKTYIQELGLAIEKEDLIIALKEKGKPKEYAKRRWDNRERYIY